MTIPLTIAGVHHVALTVSDVKRSQRFYTEFLGFNHLTDFSPRGLLHGVNWVDEAEHFY